MSKGIKITVVVVILLALGVTLLNPFNWKKIQLGNTETSISADSAEKARADKAEAELKKMKQEKAEADKKIAETIEVIDRMEKMVADMNQPPANQIANPVPANPADSTSAVIPVKKKSGVGG